MILKFNKMLLIISLLLSIGFSITVEDLSDEITIDGMSNELDYYDRILIDDDGNLLESPQDSRWDNPEYNDVKQIKANTLPITTIINRASINNTKHRSI